MKQILLVEDNVYDETLTLRALRKAGVINEIIVVHDGAEALDFLFGTGQHIKRSDADLPVFVMLDLKLPKIDGLEVLRRIRANKRTKLLPVIILTSSDEPRDLLDGYSNGANSYVCKPVEFKAFANVVGQLGLYWLVVNQPPPARL